MRAEFDLSHEHKTTADMGLLVPVQTVEVLPGDTFLGSTSLLLRMAPLVAPIMHRVSIRLHHWYVPHRLVWSDFEPFITGRDDTLTVPQVTPSADELELLDRMGAYGIAGQGYSALPVRAYNMIWNNFYRDQDLAEERDAEDLSVARIAWEKDYFTTARSQPQQGDPITIGFTAGSVPVKGLGIRNDGGLPAAQDTDVRESGATTPQTLSGWSSGQSGVDVFVERNPDSTGYPLVIADLAAAEGGISIDDLRRSLALQRFAEARMMYGERYVDYLRFLGVNPSDGRLDRPEYLGGGSQDVNFSEVLATAEGQNTNIGDLYGHGIAGLKSQRFRKAFEEHGTFFTLLSVRPKTVYQQAIPKFFLRQDNMDFWQKELEVLPWQEVSSKEVYGEAAQEDIFGYAPRYNEYRHQQSYVSGTFRQGTEEDWHLAREFDEQPTLNESFITCTPSDRIFSDTAMAECLISVFNNLRARRLVRRAAQIGGI